MNDNKIYYYLEVSSCRDTYIVKAQNKKSSNRNSRKIEKINSWNKKC